MSQNVWSASWERAPDVKLPAYRLMFLGSKSTGLPIHVTPEGYHAVSLDCDGICLDCNHPLEAQS